MHGLVPIFYIHVSVSDLYIPTIKHNSLLQEREKKRKDDSTDRTPRDAAHWNGPHR